MARYLVAGAGGTKNWSDTSIWSASSGGATGETAPTLNDAVIMDAASLSGALILTLDAASACASLDSSALDNTCTITGAVYSLSLYGSLTENATYSAYNFTGTSNLYFKGSATITTNGKAAHTLNRVLIDGSGITVTLADDCHFENVTVYLANGTFNTNGKTFWSLFIIMQAGTKTLTLGASTINIFYFYNNEPANFTFNYNTSTVIFTGNCEMTGTNTFYNLSIIGQNIITANFTDYGTITVNNVLTITGYNATTARHLIKSNTISTPRTITCNGTTNITNCDFRDIVLAGSANRNFSAQVDVGDCGGNSGITFPPDLNLYIVHTSGAMSVSDPTKWKLADLTSAGRVPLPQDSAFGVAGSFTGASTVTMDCPRIGSLDLSAVSQAVGWVLANSVEYYGHYILGNNITASGNFIITKMGAGTFNLNPFGKTIYSLYVYRGTCILLSNLTIGGVYILVEGNSTVFNTNGFNVTTPIWAYSVTVGSTILGTSIITLTSSTVNSELGGTSFSGANATIIQTPSSGSTNIYCAIVGKTLGKLQLSGSHTGNFYVTGNNTIAELIVDSGRKVRFTAGTTQAIAKLTLGTGITWSSITAAQHTINYTGSTTPVNFDYLTLSYSIVTQANRLFAGLNSTDGGNNSGWVFGQAQLLTGQLTETETMAGILSALVKITSAFTETETLASDLMVKAYITANMTESEILYSELMEKAYLTANLSEVETLNAEGHAVAKLTANFTETEILFIRNYEKITGASNFSDTISGISNYK
jgi:hypothetical protein